jgi:ATP adenylyltransferase
MGTSNNAREDVPFGPDALWAPWRMAYLEEVYDSDHPDSGSDNQSHTQDSTPRTNPTSTGSFLLDYWLAPDDDTINHVLVRNTHGMILLNKYPYTNGHLLVALGDARPSLTDYEPEQRSELWKLVDQASALVERTLEPQGMNIGINQGRAGGAGVPSHLHVHIMPRWNGDTNFITAVGGDVRALCARC